MVVQMVAFLCLGRVSALAELASMSMVCRKILGYEVGGGSCKYFSALWQDTDLVRKE